MPAIACQSSDFRYHLDEAVKLGRAATRGRELRPRSDPCIVRLKRGYTGQSTSAEHRICSRFRVFKSERREQGAAVIKAAWQRLRHGSDAGPLGGRAAFRSQLNISREFAVSMANLVDTWFSTPRPSNMSAPSGRTPASMLRSSRPAMVTELMTMWFISCFEPSA